MGLYLIRPIKPLCFVSMREPDSSAGAQPTHFAPASVCPSVRLMIMCVTGLFLVCRLRCGHRTSFGSVPPASPPPGILGLSGTDRRRVSDDGKANFTSSLTTIPPIKPRKSIAGCCVIPAFIFISLPRAVPGSTWSSASLLVSLPRPFDAEASLRCDNFKPLSTPTSPKQQRTQTFTGCCRFDLES